MDNNEQPSISQSHTKADQQTEVNSNFNQTQQSFTLNTDKINNQDDDKDKDKDNENKDEDDELKNDGKGDDSLIQDSDDDQLKPKQKQNKNDEQGQGQDQGQDDDDSVVDQEEDQTIQRPREFQITDNQCFGDDFIQESDDGVQDQQDQGIDDSDQEQQKYSIKFQSNEMKEQANQVEKTKKIKLYDYQNILFNHSLGKNRIIFLPTGKGKTLVAIASMYYYLCKEGQDKKIIFLANTIQLVKQQADSIKRNLQKIMADQELSSSLRKDSNRGKVKWTPQQIRQKVCCIHGEKTQQVGQTRRKRIQAELSSKKQMLDMFKKSTIIVMIAQMFLNCLRRGYIKITDFSFMVFDECHHCHGNHPYAGIMRQFYFDPPKPDQKELQRMKLREEQFKLPVIMGLTASPVMQETFDKNKLVHEIEQLCGNLNSRFTFYEVSKIQSSTCIEVVSIQQTGDRQVVPKLISYFQIHRDHRESYHFIRKHFPQYFQCVQKVVQFLKSKYEVLLDLDADHNMIYDLEILLLYDIKECLLIKLRDIWLELGQFAMTIAFERFYSDLDSVRLITQDNKLILEEVKQIIKQFIPKFKEKFGKCERKFFSAKVNKLIDLLQTKQQNHGEMVVVFASRRRTVEFLQIVIQKYSETLQQKQSKAFSCKRVIGYSVKAALDYEKNETIFSSDPSSFRFYVEAENMHKAYLSDTLNQKHNIKQEKDDSESRNLANEKRRMRTAKCGKLLLQIQEKYASQLQTIKSFRAKNFRVLITTSVTEQGFDIPQCKIVISFDQPSSLKSYIQIKGRARQKFSKYFIFSYNNKYKEMVSNRRFYDDIINATNQIAINKFSDKQGYIENPNYVPSIRKEQDYRKITVKESGAVLNTSYGLEILKMYCASLRHPNKLKYYFAQTPNLAFRCVIFFPQSAPTSKPYITGQSRSSKNLALKSAAFEAVKYLYKQKYIKSDLRPKKCDQIQDQRQLQKFEDLEETKKNQIYKRIFQEQVRIRCDDVHQRKFIRFYYKTVASNDLDFPAVNRKFFNHLENFNDQKFSFQVFMMNFSNSRNMKQLDRDDQSQQIGVLTCFDSKYNNEIFSGYEYRFEENSDQKFTLKLEQDCVQLDRKQYQKLKRIHQFIVDGVLGREISYYSKLTGKEPMPSKWSGLLQKDKILEIDPKRQFYPLLVILKKKNDRYCIDENCNKNIQNHQKIFKEIYEHHNYVGKQTVPKKFKLNLKNQMEQLSSQLKMKKSQGSLLVQFLQKEHCFSKCVISSRQPFNQKLDSKDPKKSFMNRNKKLVSIFQHATPDIQEVVKIVFWAKYKKQKKKQIFERDGKLSFKDVQNSRYYLLPQFILYPLPAALFFKASLAVQYLFKAVFEYTIAFEFRNNKLPQILKDKMEKQKNKFQQPLDYRCYRNVILQNGQQIFKHLSDKPSSIYLRNIGKSYASGSKFLKPNFELSFSRANMSMDESTIMQDGPIAASESMNMSELGLSNILDNSIVNKNNVSISQIQQKSFFDYSDEKSYKLVAEIKITEMLKVLTSRMYKFNKDDNYEQYEFIGDVVLKLLATLQVFLQKPQADESQLHISRANLICNVNLHRKAILKNIYRYILTKKRDELAPPYKYSLLNNVDQKFYQKTSFKVHNENSETQGFNYIPGKVHADIVEALIGAFYLHSKQLNASQLLLYFLDILKKPQIKINYDYSRLSSKTRQLPKLYSDFQARINYTFKNKGLLVQALTHSSFRSILHKIIDNETSIDRIMHDAQLNSFQFQKKSTKQFNEKSTTKIVPWETFYQRFQFLGDSILDMIVVQYLHENFRTKDQGTLSSLKQAGVSNKSLGMIAIKYGMHELILMDYPQNDKVMKQFQKILQNFNYFLNNPQALIQAKLNSIKILGDVFEALVGAIFIDLQMDYTATKTVVMNIISDLLIHYTNMEMVNKTGTLKYQQYLKENNYRECQLKKDPNSQIVNGNFRFILVDRSGSQIDQCWESTQKRAWDVILEKFYQNSKKENKENTMKISLK